MPQPEAISAGRPFFASQALPAFTARVISSSEVGQSRPMPRWAVSIASATPKPKVPQVLAVGERLLPIDRAIEPGIVGRPRIRHHVSCREGDAVEGRAGLVGKAKRLG